MKKTINESIKELHRRWDNPHKDMVSPTYSSKKYGNIQVHSFYITKEEAYNKLRNLGEDYVMKIGYEKIKASDLIQKEIDEENFKRNLKKILLTSLIFISGIVLGIFISKLII